MSSFLANNNRIFPGVELNEFLSNLEDMLTIVTLCEKLGRLNRKDYRKGNDWLTPSSESLNTLIIP